MILMIVMKNMKNLPTPYYSGSLSLLTVLILDSATDSLPSSWTELLINSGTLFSSIYPLISPVSAYSTWTSLSFFNPWVICFQSFGSTSPTNRSKSWSSYLYFEINLTLLSLSKFLSSTRIKVLLILPASNLYFSWRSPNFLKQKKQVKNTFNFNLLTAIFRDSCLLFLCR